MTEPSPLRLWAIVELLGHRRYAGLVTEEDRFGGKLGRLDVPGPKDDQGADTWQTVYFGNGSVYCLTPTTEEIAREQANIEGAAPAHVYTMRRFPLLDRGDPRDDPNGDDFDPYRDDSDDDDDE